MAENEKKSEKKHALLFLALIGGLFILLLGLNLLLKSGVLGRLFLREEEETQPNVFLYEPDYDEDIFQDEEYLEQRRSVLYTEGAQSSYLIREEDFQAAGDYALFFGNYFDSLIQGDNERYNRCFTEDYLKENGEKGRFTMQKLYDMTVQLLAEYPLDEKNPEEIIVAEFKVSYRILYNNGTFRNDLPSETARPQVYRLLREENTGAIGIQEIINYSFK